MSPIRRAARSAGRFAATPEGECAGGKREPIPQACGEAAARSGARDDDHVIDLQLAHDADQAALRRAHEQRVSQLGWGGMRGRHAPPAKPGPQPEPPHHSPKVQSVQRKPSERRADAGEFPVNRAATSDKVSFGVLSVEAGPARPIPSQGCQSFALSEGHATIVRGSSCLPGFTVEPNRETGDARALSQNLTAQSPPFGIGRGPGMPCRFSGGFTRGGVPRKAGAASA